MSAGNLKVPIVFRYWYIYIFIILNKKLITYFKNNITFRGLNGASAGVAAQHSQCFAATYG